jgi:hypothetical protein
VTSGAFVNFHQKRIAELAIKNRLPAMYNNVDAGFLMSYDANRLDSSRRAADEFELAINLKTAKQIGLTIPPECAGKSGQGHPMRQILHIRFRTSFRLPILDFRFRTRMKKTVWTRSFGYSGNLKSKTCPEISRRIEHPKWLGLWVFALVLVVTGAVAEAQQPAVPRIGFLTNESVSDWATALRLDAFRHGLRELGYVEGKNIIVEHRYAEGKSERLTELAEDLARL